ncbi:MAG: 30S ribosomal protein S3 [archaeon]
MEEKKFVDFKKEEFGVREYIKKELGKGRISSVDIEYTPVGEKIIVATSRPGLVIGRKGEKIAELTSVLKKRFKLDNPHIEIVEIREPLLDAQLVADEIAIMLERKGSLKFKVIAYRMLTQIIKAGAIGVEIRLSGKLPSDRARPWRFAHGYLKKTGEPAKIVDRAEAQAVTISGVVGVKVSILHPNADLKDNIEVNESMKSQIRANLSEMLEVKEELKEKKVKKKTPKKTTKKKATKKKAKKVEDEE